MRVRTLSLAVFLMILLAGAPETVQAHWADQAVAEVEVRETTAAMIITFPTGFVAWADLDKDGRLTAVEVEAQRPALTRFLRERIRLLDGTTAGALTISPEQTRELPETTGLSRSHSTLQLTYKWPQPVQTLTLKYDLFVPGVPTASCLATIVHGGRTRNVVFTPEHREVTLSLSGAGITHQVVGFVALGIRHIFTGYDHVLFLLSLIMLGGSLRTLIKIVTAFTVAHSLTLSLAVLEIVTLPVRWVESLIALSIAYVAAENLWRRESALRHRWLLTFGFGLVHGLGFASILTELNLSRVGLATSLVSFNIGVEIGQVVIIALAASCLRLLRAWPKEALLRWSVSAGAAAAGLVWLVQRAFLGS